MTGRCNWITIGRVPARTKRPAKHPDPLGNARRLVRVGRYRDTVHSTARKSERGIIVPEILDVIGAGFHEKRKDEFRPEYQSWTYAVRGKTIDGRALRIAVAFADEEDLLILVTAIDLGA